MSSYNDDTPALYTVEDEEPETIQVDPREFNGKTSMTKEEMVEFFCKKGLSREKVLKEVDKEFEARAPRYNGKGDKFPSEFEARQAEGARSKYYSKGYSSSGYYGASSPPRSGYASDGYSNRASAGSSSGGYPSSYASSRSPSPPRSHYERPSYGEYVYPESSGRSRGSSYGRSSSPPPPRAPSPPPAANDDREEFYSRRRPSYGEPVSPPSRSRTQRESSHRSSRRDPSPPRRAPTSRRSRGRRPSYDDYEQPHIRVRHVSPGPSTRTYRRCDGSIVIEVDNEPRRSSGKSSSSRHGRPRDYDAICEREAEIEYLMAKMNISRRTAEDHVDRNPRDQGSSSRRR